MERVLRAVVVLANQRVWAVRRRSRRWRPIGLVLACDLAVWKVWIVDPVRLHELKLPRDVGDEGDEMKPTLGPVIGSASR